MEDTLPLILEVLDDIDHFNILVLPSLNRYQTKLLKVPLMSFAHLTTCRHEFHALGEAASSPCLPVLAALSFAQIGATSSFLSVSSFHGDSLVEAG